MRAIIAFMSLCALTVPVGAGEVAESFARLTLKDWKTFTVTRKISIAQDLAKEVPESKRSVSPEKLGDNIAECLDHLSIDSKYENGMLGAAYPECVGPAARDFQ